MRGLEIGNIQTVSTSYTIADVFEVNLKDHIKTDASFLSLADSAFLKVHKIEIFFGFDFGICTFS